MPPTNPPSLWHAIDPDTAGSDPSGSLMGAVTGFAWRDLVSGTVLAGRTPELRGRTVLILSQDQVTAAAALVELDGLARRIVLYPPDLALDHLPYVIQFASVDAIVADCDLPEIPQVPVILRISPTITPASDPKGVIARANPLATEWVLLTSGTTGRPKLVLHTLASLAGSSKPPAAPQNSTIWSTFYDIRRYGGMQIFLRAILTGSSLVLSGPGESTIDFLARAGAAGVTHISGTPSHWRRALMSGHAGRIAPKYVRLSGEIADQSILSSLHAFYPDAKLGHAFATTEAGVAFDVNDGLAGFPALVVENTLGVEMKVVDRTLRIRSPRTATCYLGENAPILKDTDGFVDTGDVVELRDGRFHFYGRRDGMINVGGQKVYPEEVEAVINRHPRVEVSLVRTKKNPITGALVVADVVLKTAQPGAQLDTDASRALQREILLHCRETLASHKVPTAINFVEALAVTETGKLSRRHA